MLFRSRTSQTNLRPRRQLNASENDDRRRRTDKVSNVLRACRLANRVHAQHRASDIDRAKPNLADQRTNCSLDQLTKLRGEKEGGRNVPVEPQAMSLRTSYSCRGTPATLAIRRRAKVVCAVEAYRCFAFVLIAGPELMRGRWLSSCFSRKLRGSED